MSEHEDPLDSAPSGESGLLRQIPVFPLPNVVFFPNSRLPLHIFEARYRKMVEDCLAGSKILGMMLMKPGWEKGKIAYYEIGGLGRITNVVKYPGGTMDIILNGLCRYRVHRYIQETPYLIAEVETFEDAGWDDDPATRRTTKEMVQLFERTLYKQDEEIRKSIVAQLQLLENVLDITNYVGSILGGKHELRQRLLELSDPKERVQLLTAVFRGELAELN